MTAKQTAVSLVALYGPIIALDILLKELEAMQRKFEFYEQVYEELTLLDNFKPGTGETEQQ